MNRFGPAVLAGLVSVVCALPASAQGTVARKDTSVARAPTRQAVIESADGSYRMRIFGRLQAQYQYTSPDDVTDVTLNGGTYTNRTITEPVSVMRMRRARIGIEGNVFGPRYEYQLQLELAGAGVIMKRGYLNWKASGSNVQLRAGKFKVPYGRQQLTSFYLQQAADRSTVSDEFAKGDDDGIMVWGLPDGGHFEYYAGAFNGDGNNRYLLQDARNQYAARVAWSPFGRFALDETTAGAAPKRALTLGVTANLNGGWLFDVNGVAGIQGRTRSCISGACTDNEGDDASILHTNAEMAFRLGRINGSAEYFARTIDPELSTAADVKARGWYAQLAAALVPQRYDAGLRYGTLDRDVSKADDSIDELTIFANDYIRGNDLKIQADYTLIKTGIAATHTTLNDKRVRVQLVVTF